MTLRASALLAALLVVGCNAPGICDTGAECGVMFNGTESCSCYSPARIVLEARADYPTEVRVMCRCRPALDGGKRQ